MLISYEYGAAIMTPVQTGMIHVARMLCEGKAAGFKQVRPYHRYNVPLYCEDFLRLTIVRNPWHRLESIYRYLVAGGNAWRKEYFTYSGRSFAEFIKHFMLVRKHARTYTDIVWTANYTDLHKLYKPDHIYKRERGMDALRWKLEELGMRCKPIGDPWPDFKVLGTVGWSTAMLELVEDYTEPDASKWDYPKPRLTK